MRTFLPYLICATLLLSKAFTVSAQTDNMEKELKRVAMESADSCAMQHINDWTAIKNKVKNNVSGYLYKSTRRSPMILPVITEI